MEEYKPDLTTNAEQSDDCHACGWKTNDLKRYPRYPDGSGPYTWLCDICRNCLAGNATINPRVYAPGVSTIANVVVYCTHLILRRLDAMERRLRP